MKRTIGTIGICLTIYFLPFFTLNAQDQVDSYYQGITIAPTYSYHLSGRTDRVKGYLIKIDDISILKNPGLVILARWRRSWSQCPLSISGLSGLV